MNNKEQYYEIVDYLKSEGLATEVCVCDDVISILNLADMCYMVNFLSEKKQRTEFVSGFLANSEIIRHVSKGLKYYKALVLKYRHRLNVMDITPENIDKLRKIKLETMENGPSEFIDYQMEEELVKKNKRGK